MINVQPAKMTRTYVKQSTQPDNLNSYQLTGTFSKRDVDNYSKSQHRSTSRQQEDYTGYTMPSLRQPHFIPKDKENLTNEIMLLKINNNDLIIDQKHLKTTNTMLEREIRRLQLLVSQNMERYNCNNLVPILRQKYKEVKQRLKERDKYIDAIKRNIKYSKTQELEVELELYKAETVRMRIQIDEFERLQRQFMTQNQIDDTYVKLDKELFTNLIQDNQQMFTQIKDYQKELKKQMLQYQNQLKSAHNGRISANHIVSKYYRSVQEKDQEIHLLRKRVEDSELQKSFLKVQEKQSFESISFMALSKEKDRQIEQVRQELSQAQQQIKEFEFDQKYRSQQTKQSYYEGHQTSLKVQRELDMKVHQHDTTAPLNVQIKKADIVVRRRDSSLDQKTIIILPQKIEPVPLDPVVQKGYSNDVRSTIQYQMQLKRYQMFAQFDNYEQILSDMQQIEEMRTLQRWQKRLRKLGLADVASIGMLLRYRLMDQNITLEEMTEKLIPQEAVHDGLLSLMEMEFLVQQTPFSLDAYQSNLLARYLTEDNSDEYIYYDPQRQQEAQIIKSVFRKVVGRYDVFTEAEKEEVRQQTYEIVCKKFKASMIDTIRMLMGKAHPETCLRSDFQSALKFCDLQLPSRCLEYLHLVGFQTNRDDILKVNYNQILDYFDLK